MLRLALCGNWGVVWCRGTCWTGGLPFGVVSLSKTCCKIVIQSHQLTIKPRAKGFIQ